MRPRHTTPVLKGPALECNETSPQAGKPHPPSTTTCGRGKRGRWPSGWAHGGSPGAKEAHHEGGSSRLAGFISREGIQLGFLSTKMRQTCFTSLNSL